MVRTIIALIILIAALLWLPLWVQLMLFALAVIFVRYRYFILVPALFADALYAPAGNIALAHLKVTAFVLAVLCIRWVIITQTRIGILYANRT